jgi:hypothetical protein
MIRIDYELSPGWKQSWANVNLAEASESDLLYRVLLGDVCIVVDSTEFNASWGWIPIVEVAASFQQVADTLSRGNEVATTYEFTESEANIQFRRFGNDLTIVASFVPGSATVAFGEFVTAVRSFAARVGRELREQHPALRENKSFSRLLPEPESK